MKTVVLLNVVVETIIHFSGFFDWKFQKEQYLFKIEIFWNIINVFTVTFDQFNGSLLNNCFV